MLKLDKIHILHINDRTLIFYQNPFFFWIITTINILYCVLQKIGYNESHEELIDIELIRFQFPHFNSCFAIQILTTYLSK